MAVLFLKLEPNACVLGDYLSQLTPSGGLNALAANPKYFPLNFSFSCGFDILVQITCGQVIHVATARIPFTPSSPHDSTAGIDTYWAITALDEFRAAYFQYFNSWLTAVSYCNRIVFADSKYAHLLFLLINTVVCTYYCLSCALSLTCLQRIYKRDVFIRQLGCTNIFLILFSFTITLSLKLANAQCNPQCGQGTYCSGHCNYGNCYNSCDNGPIVGCPVNTHQPFGAGCYINCNPCGANAGTGGQIGRWYCWCNAGKAQFTTLLLYIYYFVTRSLQFCTRRKLHVW